MDREMEDIESCTQLPPKRQRPVRTKSYAFLASCGLRDKANAPRSGSNQMTRL